MRCNTHGFHTNSHRWPPKPGPGRPPSGSGSALGTLNESTDPLPEEGSCASSSVGRQSQSLADTTSCCPAMRRLALTSRTRFTGRMTTSVGGAGEESNRPATTFSQSWGLAAPAQEVVEGYRKGARVEAPKGPLGQMAVVGEVYRGGFGVPREHQCRVHQHQEEASGGEGRGLARGGWRGR